MEPYERSPQRRDHANGYKDKTLQTRVGPLALSVSQTCSGNFYPSALERGQRSERALTLALAEIYVQGVATRRVSAIVEELCGTSVSMGVSVALSEHEAHWRQFLSSLSISAQRELAGLRNRRG